MFKKIKKNMITLTFKKSQIKLLEIKIYISQMKNTLKSIKSRLAATEQNISELEDIEIKPT